MRRAGMDPACWQPGLGLPRVIIRPKTHKPETAIIEIRLDLCGIGVLAAQRLLRRNVECQEPANHSHHHPLRISAAEYGA